MSFFLHESLIADTIIEFYRLGSRQLWVFWDLLRLIGYSHQFCSLAPNFSRLDFQCYSKFLACFSSYTLRQWLFLLDKFILFAAFFQNRSTRLLLVLHPLGMSFRCSSYNIINVTLSSLIYILNRFIMPQIF